MFTGIIQAVGQIESMVSKGVDKQIRVNTAKLGTSEIALGDSIAVNGVCLTATDIDNKSFLADVSGETIQHTTFRELAVGSAVNLELALMPHSRLGGHLVSGHVDGVGQLLSITPDGQSMRYEFDLDRGLSHYVARKGSICIDGVSLTVNHVAGQRFGVNLVPHTLSETTLKHLVAGSRVNIEVDLISRYLERLLTGKAEETPSKTEIDEMFLAKNGILTT